MSDLKDQDLGPEHVSKSQRKRDSTALQGLAAELAKLSQNQLESLDLPKELFDAVVRATAIKKGGARKRQIKYTGGLLRKMEVEPILEGLNRLKSTSVEGRRRHHRIEKWRDQLLTEGDTALAGLLTEFPSIDRQRIRQLIRDAQQQDSAGKPPTARRGLYQYLREQFDVAEEYYRLSKT